MLNIKIRYRNSKTQKHGERGFASIETTILMFSFFVILSYTVGTFGVVHSGILNSISARAYAFETFRQRANVTYFRDEDVGGAKCSFKNIGFRTHGISVDGQTGDSKEWLASPRSISAFGIGDNFDPGDRSTREGPVTRPLTATIESQMLKSLNDKKSEDQAAVVMIKVMYGMCLNSSCGGAVP
jgi:hypothetical protein